MFSSPMSYLVVTVLLSLVVVLIAGLSEGRLRHVLRVAFGLEQQRGKEHLFDEIERPESDWTVLGGVHSEPDEVSGGQRAKEWAAGAYGQAKEATRGVVDAGREQWAKASSEPAAETGEFPTTGELAIGRR